MVFIFRLMLVRLQVQSNAHVGRALLFALKFLWTVTR